MDKSSISVVDLPHIQCLVGSAGPDGRWRRNLLRTLIWPCHKGKMILDLTPARVSDWSEVTLNQRQGSNCTRTGSPGYQVRLASPKIQLYYVHDIDNSSRAGTYTT